MRYETYTQKDTVDAEDGDVSFVGIDTTRGQDRRDVLRPGYLAAGQNTRLRTGSAAQRDGTIRPADFNPGFAARIVGSGVFRDPNSNELLMIAPASVTYAVALRYGTDSFHVPYDSGVVGNNGTGGVNFVQAFDKLLLLRFPVQAGAKNLIWDGVTTDKWEEQVLSANGLTLVPPSWNAEPFQDRIAYYNQNYLTTAAYGFPSRDVWLLSDVEDPSSYDPVFQVFRENSGQSDFITRIMSYFDQSLLIFKRQSILQTTILTSFGVTSFGLPTIAISGQHQELTLSLGSIGNHMPLEIGGDVIFLSEKKGFYRLSEVIQNRTISLPVALSEPIQDVIDSIQWGATGIFGCSAALDNYALFGVGLGINATRCNALLVYNTQSRNWESVPDTWADPTFGFNALHVTNYADVQRIFAVDYDNGIVYLLFEGTVDDLATGIWNVPYKIETRGYVCNDAVSFKRFIRSKVTISTSNPSINVTAISDGFNEEKLLTPIPLTKDRLKFYIHGHPVFNPLTDDPNAPLREDYSNPLNEQVAIEDFENLAIGPISNLPGTTISDDVTLQSTTEPFEIRDTGRWISLRIENSQGVCNVDATAVESTRSMNTFRTAA